MKNKTLVYVFDPLCGWCFGIKPIVKKFLEQNPNLNFELRLGGLFILEGAKPYKDYQRHINTARVRLEEVTGQALSEKFDRQILASESLANSSTPCEFLMDIKKQGLSSRDLFNITCELQYLHYIEGEDLNIKTTYQKALDQVGLGDIQFELFTDPMDVCSEVLDEFRQTQGLGGYGFPSFFVKKHNNYKHIPHSYDENEFFEKMNSIFN